MQHSPSMNCFLLADSHMKFIRSTFVASSYNLVTRSIPGLKWVDKYDQKLSVYVLLSIPDIQLSLSQANAVLLSVGTNSVRILPATEIISEVQQIILLIQQTYPHLNHPQKISISLTFPCFKTTRRFSTVPSLISNINSYNEKLKLLSMEIGFNTIDFHITGNHLAYDHMHLQSCFQDRIFNSIINHFDQLIQAPSSMITTADKSNPTSPSTSTSTSDKEEPTQSSHVNQEEKKRRNKQRHRKMKNKQQQHMLKRKVHHQWTIPQIKQYLDSHHIHYGCIPSIYRNILRLKFNNQNDQDTAGTQLGIDVFNENHYKEYVNSLPS